MSEYEALVALNMVWEMGSIRLKRLLEFFGTPQKILKVPLDKLNGVYGIGPEIAGKIHSLRPEDVTKEFAQAEKLDLKIIDYTDKNYPENLKEIPGFPIVLYIKGELKPADKLSLAIVGSRRASFYGLTCAERLAGELARRQLTIVSGLARGIDTYAHRGALKQGGRTIAVMGSGFNNIYPQENKELAEEIAKNGAVISEFPLDAQPWKQNFPRRNRLISGLSLGTLVVEAARNSGALITADFALEQGREVFALPGKVDAKNSFGTNGLIKQGAKLVSCVDDIMEELQPYVFSAPPERTSVVPQKLAIAEKESFLYNLISYQPALLDDIVEKLDIDIPEISSLLLRLQVKKLIKQLPGKLLVRV